MTFNAPPPRAGTAEQQQAAVLMWIIGGFDVVFGLITLIRVLAADAPVPGAVLRAAVYLMLGGVIVLLGLGVRRGLQAAIGGGIAVVAVVGLFDLWRLLAAPNMQTALMRGVLRVAILAIVIVALVRAMSSGRRA